MKENAFSQLSDQELLEKKKQLKSSNIINAVIIGVLIGVVIYSFIKSGFRLFTFLPLLFVYFIVKNQNESKELEKEIKSRNVKQE
ncbi:putative permease [Chryseobacterium ginsenosidimutans]|uniref:FUSC family protein n=1 Tax=Chryseobacterium ginsenosidimutans TaxID=687846 RepID=UPI00278796B8|nr:FUSC family protein [Chryseobacterium ginsenosidimutans]MDQ0594759.1 putative permease [Chryseobacterium ginsenosidimutans]